MNQAMDVFSLAGFHESPLLFVEWTDQQLVGMSKASAVSTKSVFKLNTFLFCILLVDV
jgi:hypothetical protein